MRQFCIALAFIFSTALCIGQVQIKLKQPPMNQLGVKDMWNLTLRNTSAKDVQLTLRGTADEAQEGRLVDGKTGLFTLKANESRTISGSNIPGGGSYSWQNKKFQEAMVRSGNAPSGNYTICVYAESESGAPLGQDCFRQNIALMSPPTLISPADGASIAQGQTPLFTWIPSAPSQQGTIYTIRIVEVLGNQSANDAIIKNSAVFEQKDIRSTSLQYPVSARKLVEGRKYVWQISSGELKSEASGFGISTSSHGHVLSNLVNTQRIICKPCETNNVTANNLTAEVLNTNKDERMREGSIVVQNTISSPSPNRITRIEADLVSVTINPQNPECTPCSKQKKNQNCFVGDNFIATNNTLWNNIGHGEISQNSSNNITRSLTFKSLNKNGVDISGGIQIQNTIGLPPVSCCGDEVEVWIRYTVWDVQCHACEKLVKAVLHRKSSCAEINPVR